MDAGLKRPVQTMLEALWRWNLDWLETLRVLDMAGSVPLSPVGELERRETAVAGLRAGVVEMEESPSYLMLSDAAPGTTTASRYSAPIAEAQDLWFLLDAASNHLGIARRYADEQQLTASSIDRKKLQGLQELLARPVVVAASPDQSKLAGTTMSFQQALALLHQRHDALYQGVAKVDHVWLNVLPRIEAARETAARLRTEARDLGVTEPLIGRVENRAEQLADLLMTDPVAVEDGDGLELDRMVSEAARQMATLRSGFDNLDSDLSGTEERLANLRVMRSRAAAAAAEASAKILGPHEMAAVPTAAILDGDGGMADQLDEVFALARQLDRARWTQQRAVLDTWLSKVDRLEQQLAEAERRNRAPLDQRDELRGRLHAFQAKMAATGKAENPSAMKLADDAWTELYTAPTDLTNAESVIAELAAELRKP